MNAIATTPHEVPTNRAAVRPHELPTVQDLMQEALWYRSWGWSVFPLSRQKTPLQSWKRWQTARPTDHEIGRMFSQKTSRIGGLAVVLGRISGGGSGCALAVRDFDTVEGYERWSNGRPELARQLPTVRTGRGYHVHVRLRGPEVFRKFADGDLRADRGHYAVLPPSIHPSGKLYRWLRAPLTISDIPILDLADTGFVVGDNTRPIRAKQAPEAAKDKPSKKTMACVHGTPVFEGSPELSVPVGEAVLRTLPRRAGQRNEKLLALAKSLKDIAPGVQPEHWRVAVKYWWTCALPVIATKDFGTTWLDFCRAWARAAEPMSFTLPRLALTKAAQASDEPMTAIMAGCRALADTTGGTFHLSVRTAADAAQVSVGRAHKLLKHAVNSGLLVVVEKGKRSATLRMATTYRLGKQAA